MNYKTFNDLNLDIKENLHRLHDKKFDLIVGIPRSGMIPAYTIGLYLNVHVIDFNGFLENRILQKGITREIDINLINAWDAKNVLIVDDSIWSGKSMKEKIDLLPQNLKEKITTLAIYSNIFKREDVNMTFKHVEPPRVFEWNVFHRDLLSQSCVDIDGVLCHDPTEMENDDGQMYIDFVLNAKPYILPSYKIHSLVTSRLEKYRTETEIWLKKHNIKYEHLIMLDLPSKEERLRLNIHAIHKANYFKNSGLDFFIESNINQAKKIMEIVGKPVFCVDENIMLNPINYEIKGTI